MSRKKTKLQQCKDIAHNHPHLIENEDNAALIDLFIREVGMSEAGARSYLSKIKETFDAEHKRQQMEHKRSSETDEEIAKRLNERFSVIEMLANASCKGKIRSLIISGPAGLGKSYTVEQAIRRNFPDGKDVSIVKGFVRPTGLYLLLYKHRSENQVIVMDDSDSIFANEDALNLLKVACDTTRNRTISWRAETRMVDENGDDVPQEFEFNGTIIFITNKDFDDEIERGARGSEHFEALISRSHYVECDMHTQRDYIVRIKQVVREGMLEEKGLNCDEQNMIVKFIEDNSDKLRELTLRMALKLADVYNMNADKFESLAKISCFKHEAVRH